MKNMSFKLMSLALLALVAAQWSGFEAQTCHPSGHLRGKKAPKGQCNTVNNSDCCKDGKKYPVFRCSPAVTAHTKATMTLNSFEKGQDGGGPSECDNKYHSDSKPVVALSTGWFNHMKRCHHYIKIHGNGRSVKAMVVDECDSTEGCDSEHDFQPPFRNNIVVMRSMMHQRLCGKPWASRRTAMSGV